MSFIELGLHASQVKRCEALGYLEPTPIQREAIPRILEGGDMIGCAAPGTGKTAAFLLPMLQRLRATANGADGKAKNGVRALIIAPTRELAAQIADNMRLLDRHTRAVNVVGGASMHKQREDLRRGTPVVIATPGRLIDHMDNRVIDLSQVEILVLDEADRMLDMGFLPSIRRILDKVPAKRQTLLFSATMMPSIEGIARSYMRDPEVVEVNERGKAALTIRQTAYPVGMHSKTALLLHLLGGECSGRVLVFTRTRRGAESLAITLTHNKQQADRIHADRTQPQRDAALREFKKGNCRILVATDIAARGIDIESVSHVINYDLPDQPEDYVHRIGRTGRAGAEGRAISLLTPIDELSMREIERTTGQIVERIFLPEFGGLAPLTKPATPFMGGRSRSSGSRSFSPRR
ncbi:MAG: DEAD/DEAH box helicase [Blastocatellia bacterium]